MRSQGEGTIIAAVAVTLLFAFSLILFVYTLASLRPELRNISLDYSERIAERLSNPKGCCQVKAWIPNHPKIFARSQRRMPPWISFRHSRKR